MKIAKILSIPSLIILSAVFTDAASITSTWSGDTFGANTWEVNTNWAPSIGGKPYPNNGTDAYTVVIGSTTADRTIQTSGNITLTDLGIIQAASSTGINTLKLGGNMTVANTSANSYFTNATGDASKFVIDLNGHNFTMTSNVGNIDQAINFTITGGGIYSTYQFYQSSGASIIGAGVTVKITATGNVNYISGVATWDNTSTLHYSANNAAAVTLYHSWVASSALGNLVVGDHTNTVASSLKLSSTHIGDGLYVKGNVTSLTNEVGGGAKLEISTGKMNVGGNFIDEGTDAHSYGTGTIFFNGGAATERTLSTGRSGLTTSFQVGRVAAEAGNVALGQDLTTTGKFTVRRESLLNVEDFTLQAANIDLNGGTSTASIKPTISFTFGLTNSGLIYATNTLTLGFATLNISYDGAGWVGTNNIELFRFGTLSAGPLTNLALNFIAPGDFSHGGLQQVGNSIYLMNVIPEPSSALLLLMGVAFLLYRRKRG